MPQKNQKYFVNKKTKFNVFKDLDKFGPSDDCRLRIIRRVKFGDVEEPLVLTSNYFYLFCSFFPILLHVSLYAVLDFGIRYGRAL